MGVGKQTNKLVIQLGDGGDPEVFAYTCGANTDSVSLTNNLDEQVSLDCDNPLDMPAVITRTLESQDTTLTISGMVTTEAWPTWRDWADSGATKNVKIEFYESAANNGGHWILPAILSGLEFTRENKRRITFSATIAGNGQRVWTTAT